MIGRAILLVLCAATAAADPVVPGSTLNGSHGRAMVAIDPIGIPIAMVPVELERGVYYEIQTIDLQNIEPLNATADTVATLRDGNDTDARTLGGADLCETPGAEPDERRSCFRAFVDPSMYPPGRIFYVWIRARTTGQRGTTDVRIQRLASQGAIPEDRACGPGETASCWQSVANDWYFGGLVMRAGAGADATMRLETTALPTNVEHSSMILVVPGSLDDEDTNWQIPSDRRGGPLSHRSGATGAAEWVGRGSEVGVVDAAIFVATSTNGGRGAPIRLVKNDRAEHFTNDGVFVTGTDFDGDGLGADLEHVLRTCDSPSTATFGDMPCAERPGCADEPDSRLCKASLRDSDGDALRDDHELFGVAIDGSSHLTELPRFGADPAHYDVFVELDRYRYDTPACFPGMTEPELYTPEKLRDIARIYRAIEDFRNRDGTNGIYVHVDAGVSASVDNETSHGNWGGSLTVPVGTPIESAMHRSRRFLFRHMFQVCGGDLRHSEGAPSISAFVDGGSTVFLHELAHAGGLHHGGSASIRGTGAINKKPNHWSRINYLFVDWLADRFGLPEPDPDITKVTFSTGRFTNRPLNPRDADEACPFGPGVDTSAAEDLFPWRMETGRYPGCLSVDWNDDGRIATPGQVVEAPILRNRAVRLTQQYGWTSNTAAGSDLAIATDMLYSAHIRVDESGARTLNLRVNRGITCDECSLDLGSCWDPDTTDEEHVLVDGDLARTVAIAARVGPDTLPVALVVYGDRDGRLRHGLVHTFTARWIDLGPVPWAHRLGGSLERQIPDAVATDDGFMIVYRADGDRVVTQRARQVSPAELVWGVATDALNETGATFVPRGESSPAIGKVTWPGFGERIAIVMADPRHVDNAAGSGSLTLRVLDDAGRWAFVLFADAFRIRGRPSFAQVDYGNGPVLAMAWLGGDRLVGDDHEQFFHRFTIPGSTQSGDPPGDRHFVPVAGSTPKYDKSPFTMPLVFDTRGPRSTWGLRAIYFNWFAGCDEGVDTCPAWASACVDPSGGIDGPDTRGRCTSATDPTVGAGTEYRLPFADGVFAGRIRDYDDRPGLRLGFCQGLRECADGYADESCVPERFEDRDEGDQILRSEMCDPEPVLDAPCNVVVVDADGDTIPDELDPCPSQSTDIDLDRDGCPDDLDDIVGFGEQIIVPRLRNYIDVVIVTPGLPDESAAKMQNSIDDLIGNNGGSSDNGMFDKLRSNEWVAAGTKARHAVLSLIDADAAGFDTKREQAEVVLLYRESLALHLTKSELSKGDKLSKAGDYEGAIIAYKNAAKRL